MAVRRVERVVPRAEKKTLNIKKKVKNKNDKVLVVAQEIKFAKILAGNEKKARDKVLKHLRKWLTFRSSSTYDFTEQDFMRLWKGLFYCVWMSDKPLVQEDLCESISKLFDCFGNKVEISILFYKCFLKTMAADWFGIDQHRLDKFLMFVRRMSRGVLYCLKDQKWSVKSVSAFSQCLTSDDGLLSPDHPKLCLGLQMHLADCWMEEVAKVSQGDISAKAVVELSKPFAQFLSYGDEARLANSITRNVFIHLARQTDIGIEYQQKFDAWRAAGCPGGSVDTMQRVEEENNDDSDVPEDDKSGDLNKNMPLDPRAGHIHTDLPQLPVDGMLLSAMFKKLSMESGTTKLNREKLRMLSNNFEMLASGTYPYKMKNVVLANDPKFKIPKTRKKAMALLDFGDNLIMDYEDEAMRGMNKRQRRKYLMKQRKMLEEGLLSDDKDVDETDSHMQDSHPPIKKAKKKQGKVDQGTWTVENIDILECAQPDSILKSSSVIKSIEEKIKSSKKSCSETDLSINGTSLLEKVENIGKKNKSLSQESLITPVKKPSKQANRKKLKDDLVSDDSSADKKSENSMPLVTESPRQLNKKPKKTIKMMKSNLSDDNVSPTSNGFAKNRPQSRIPIYSSISSTTALKKKTKKSKTPSPQTNLSIDSAIKIKSTTKELKNSPKKKAKSIICLSSSTPKNNGILKNSSQSNTSFNSSLLSQSNLSRNDSVSSQKKVMIALKKNTAQGVMDYFKSVKQSPEIPFDCERKPMKTALKPNAMPSPINPFYKKKLNLNF